MSKPFAETSQDRKDRLAKIRTEWDKIGAVPDQPPALPTEAASPDDADDEPQGDGRTVTSDELEDEVRTTLLYGMRYGKDRREKVAAAVAAIKYLAVKAKIPVPFGGGFDEEEN